MAAATPQLDEIWNDLSIVLENIFRLDSLERADFISQDRFMSLYNAVERYFSSAEYDNSILTASQSKAKPNENENGNQEVELPGGGFYYRIKNFFRNYLQAKTSNNNGEGEVFLDFYAKTWEAYQKSSQIANSILGGVNKGWVVRQQRNKMPNIHDIFTVAMHIWQDIFFKDSNNSLSRTCLELINRERNGEKINSRLIKQVIDSYVSAGFTANNAAARSVERTLSTYIEYFEKSFLEATEQYYKAEVTVLLAQDGVINYAKKVYKRFEEEESRVTNILHKETLPKVQALLTEILIENQVITLQEELIRVLREEKLDEIALLFNLVNRIPSANDPVIQQLEIFAKQECLAAIEAVKSTANKDPKCYCEAIIGIYLRFLKIVKEGFSNHQGYCAALDRAFGSAVNNNAVTQEVQRSIRSAELLAAYCDMLLRKGNKIEDLHMEEKFDHIMIMFNYIEDKDAFGKFYGKRLAKRLVNQLSASDDFEELMILKLKDKCGFEYTSKLQRMFEDINLSKNLISQYKSDCERRAVIQTIDFDVMVLRSNAWPFSSPAVFNLSIELRRVVDSFTNFYTRTHTGRKLEWIYQHCRGELQTLFTKPKYILQVSTYQITILLLFNFDSNLTVETIQEKTKLDDEILRQVLLILLKSKILKCPQINPSDINDNYSEKNIQSTFDIQVNENFKSAKVKINVNAPLRAIEKSESDRDTQQIDEERKFVVQAAIVRTMKARKGMKHALLVQEVIDQLKGRFQPKVPMIKKCIDILIEKEYLERDNKERDQLRYLA